jgi:hypothetical protein
VAILIAFLWLGQAPSTLEFAEAASRWRESLWPAPGRGEQD